MEEERKISTYTADEKEAMERFNSFEVGINMELGENEKITKINFYNGANFKDGVGRDFDFEGDLYVVEKETENGEKQTYIYAGSPDNIIGFVDENGNIEFVDAELKSLGITMTLDEFKEINFEKLMVKSEELTPEELEEYLAREKEEGRSKNEEDEKENDNPEDEKEKAEEELSEKSGNDYHFYFYKKITKPGLANEISGSQGKELAFAIDSNKGAMIIDTETGERLSGTGEGKFTLRTAITINEHGKKFDRQNLNAIIKTNNSNKELGVRFGQYGEPELYTMEVTPSAERIATRVGLHTESDKRIDRETNDGQNGRGEKIDLAENFETTEDLHDGEEINKDTKVVLKDGTESTIGKEADKAKIPVEEFIEKYETADGNTMGEKIENVHDEVDEEFRMSPFSRR